MHTQQAKDLRTAAYNFSEMNGARLSSLLEEKAALLLSWLDHLSKYKRTGTADSLLDALSSSVIESAGLLSLGLVRPTIFSLRGQVDLLLAWLYFKDHRVEWIHVNDTGDGFKLKKEIFSYLDQHYPRFGSRFGILKDIKTRGEADPYRMLSAHIHAQSDPVLPRTECFSDLVRAVDIANECAGGQFEIGEYLNDILLGVYAHDFVSLPRFIQESLISRFKSPEQRKSFFQ